VIWLVLLACERVDPELERLQSSLLAYDQGRAALTEGRPDDAVEAFERAQALDPQSAELALWLAKANADAGDLSAALVHADQSLRLDSSRVEAWYNRACWRVRAGDLAGGADDLATALASEQLDPLQVALDPDLEPLRASPEWAHVVPAAVLPTQVVPDDTRFVGDTWTLTVRVQHPPDQRPVVSSGPLPGVLAHRRTVVIESPGEPLWTTELRYDFAVLGPGVVDTVVSVSAGPLPSEPAPIRVDLLGPEIEPLPETTGALALHAPLLDASVGATRQGDQVWVRADPGDTVQWDVVDAVVIEGRLREQPAWVGWTASVPTGTPVTVLRDGAPAWTGTP
jgi:hypothetical protein